MFNFFKKKKPPVTHWSPPPEELFLYSREFTATLTTGETITNTFKVRHPFIYEQDVVKNPPKHGLESVISFMGVVLNTKFVVKIEYGDLVKIPYKEE